MHLYSLVSEFLPGLQFQALIKLSTNAKKVANYVLASSGPKTCLTKMVEVTVVKEMKKLYSYKFK